MISLNEIKGALLRRIGVCKTFEEIRKIEKEMTAYYSHDEIEKLTRSKRESMKIDAARRMGDRKQNFTYGEDYGSTN